MRIIINVSGNLGGGGRQVAISFINECIKFDSNEYYIFLGDAIKSELKTTDFPSNFTFIHTGRLKFYQMHKHLSQIESRIIPDVVFTVFGPSYWRPKAPHLIGFANGFYLFPESEFFKIISCKDSLLLRLKRFVHLKYLKWESDAIVCETDEATSRCRSILGENKLYATVSNTCNAYFINKKCNNKQILPDRITNEFRLLTLTKYYRHKNIELIPDVIDHLIKRGYENFKFVLTIDHDNFVRIFDDTYKNYVINVGPVTIWDCPSLYAECDAMFLPTMLECFSASYPEAMCMGVPIITSHYDFAKSICKNAAAYFDPLNTSNIADEIINVFKNAEFRDSLVKEGFDVFIGFPNAETRAKNYLDICYSIMKQ